MKVVKTIIINKSIDEVWKVWAEEFDKAGVWMAQVDHTIQKSTGTKLDGAPMIGRVCNFSPNPEGAKAIEDIILYDEVNYKLHLRVIPENIPIPLEKNIFKSSLKRLAYDKTELVVEANIELKWTGYFLYPVIKKGFNKSYSELLEELKYFLEEGKAHPRKQRKNKAA